MKTLAGFVLLFNLLVLLQGLWRSRQRLRSDQQKRDLWLVLAQDFIQEFLHRQRPHPWTHSLTVEQMEQFRHLTEFFTNKTWEDICRYCTQAPTALHLHRRLVELDSVLDDQNRTRLRSQINIILISDLLTSQALKNDLRAWAYEDFIRHRRIRF